MMTLRNFLVTNSKFLLVRPKKQELQVPIETEQKVIMIRYTIFGFMGFRLWLHKFLNISEPEDQFHNHSWAYISLCLWGKYREQTIKNGVYKDRTKKMGQITVHGTQTFHRITTKGCWTLCLATPFYGSNSYTLSIDLAKLKS